MYNIKSRKASTHEMAVARFGKILPLMQIFKKVFGHILSKYQCDQIWRFIGLWATFKAFGNNKFAQISHFLRQFL